ncbi:hypothetical protein D3C77_569930 [compost metagenome]
MREAAFIAAVTHEQLEHAIQSGFVLLARQLLDAQLIGRLVVFTVLRQARFEVGDFGQVCSLAQEGQLRLGTGQRRFVLVAFDCIEHSLGFIQFAALCQAAGVQNQRTGIAVIFAQQRLEGGFGFAEATFAKLYLSEFQRISRRRRWHLHMRLE